MRLKIRYDGESIVLLQNFLDLNYTRQDNDGSRRKYPDIGNDELTINTG
jgi:hypothetical protein